MGKVYVFRHGESVFNSQGRFTGFIDSKLTKKGLEDAKIISERLKHVKFELAFHTSLTRSKQTLNEVLKHHKECQEVIEDDRLIERDYGNLAGKTHWEVVKKYGVGNYDKWHRGFDSAPPNGESFRDVEKRVASFVKDLKQIVKERKVNVCIAAHGNSIRLFRKIMEKSSEKEAISWTIPYDNFIEYSIK